MNIFLALNKIHTNSYNSKSATGLIKSNKIIIKIPKLIQIYFSPIFWCRESCYPIFHIFYFWRKLIWIKPKYSKLKIISKRTFPNFHFCFYDLHEFKFFHHKTLERRWHDFFHLFKWQGVLKIFGFYLEIFSNSKTLSNSMIFMREDKMTSSKHMKYELEV